MKVGDRVRTRRFDNVGKILHFYEDFWEASFGFQHMTGRQWLDQQAIPFSEDELLEVWASIGCDDGGTVLAPLSDLEGVSP